jgi:hypothetical protein
MDVLQNCSDGGERNKQQAVVSQQLRECWEGLDALLAQHWRSPKFMLRKIQNEVLWLDLKFG